MKHRRSSLPSILLAAVALLVVVEPSAHAAGQLNEVVRAFSEASEHVLWRAQVQGQVAFKLLAGLEVLMMLYGFALLFLSGKLTAGGLLAATIKKAILLGLGLLALNFYPIGVPLILKTFTQAGSVNVGLPGMTPTALLGQGIYLCGRLLYTTNNAGFVFAGPVTFLCWAAGTTIFVCFVLLAYRVVATLAESFVLLGGGIFFLGFWANRVTAALAENYIVAVIRLGITTYFLYLMVAIANALLPLWTDALSAPVNSADGLLPMMTTLGEVVIFTMIATRMPPRIAYDLTAPSSFLGLRSAMATNP